jgi:glycerol-3-phosphate dehydrogenase
LTKSPGVQTPTSRTFSVSSRHASLAAARREPADLLVIGGGITGAGVALDAARRGLSVVLVEARDLASGTSSTSSRLIHGGLRYLETLDFRLVFESLGERRRLLELAPHVVSPLPFLFPVWDGGSVGLAKLSAGMWLYDLLSLFRGVTRHRLLRAARTLEREPQLKREGLKGGAVYYDAQVDDSRLTMLVARAAHRAGAVVLTYTEVTDFLRQGDRITGVRLRDGSSGASFEIAARVLVNATGPWSDRLRALAEPTASPRLRPTKGVHLLLERERVGNRGGLIFPSPVDGRIMFVLPWGRFTYVGTTDTDFSGEPAEAAAEASDVRYLLDSVNGVFPEARLHAGDVRSTWAGVRPLLAPGGKGDVEADATSREHEVWEEPAGLITVAGGKLTTYRTMAAEVVDRAGEVLHRDHGMDVDRSDTASAALTGAAILSGDPVEIGGTLEQATRALGLADGSGIHLAGRYGPQADAVLELVRADPSLGERLDPELPYLKAEVVHAVRAELATRLDDVLERRLHLFHEARDGGMGVAAETLDLMASAAEGLPPWSAAEQLEAYRRRVERSRASLHLAG